MGLVFIAINILIYLVAIATWIAIPDELTLNVSVTVFNLCYSSILIICYRKELERYYTSNFFKRLVGYGTSAFLILCIIGMVNYLAFKHPINIDFTPDGRNSITDQSRKILKDIKGSVTVKVFSRKNQFEAIRSLLDLYRFEKNDLHLQLIDVELRPELVSKYNILKSPSIVLEKGSKKETVTNMDERSITNAFINLSRASKPIIYYSVGHDELDIGSKENNGGHVIYKSITDMSYKLTKVNLNTISGIPKSVKALAIWGPRSGFFENEIKVIDSYLKDGGKLMIALDPSLKQDKLKNMRKLLNKWGFSIQNNYVIDRMKHVSGSKGSVPIVFSFDKRHEITQGIESPVFFPLTSSVSKIDNKSNVTILAHSTPFPASWAENNLQEFLEGKVAYVANKDTKGPVGYMGVWNKEGANTKIVAYGNSSFVSNAYSNFPKNFILFLSSLSWLINDDHILSFNNNVIKDRPVFVSSSQLGMIFYFSVLFAPMALFAAAIFIYFRRAKT